MSMRDLFSAKQEDLFERFLTYAYPLTLLSQNIRVKYTECVKERGVVRFEQHEKTLPKESLRRLIEEICKTSS
jgi:hypothetical protein